MKWFDFLKEQGYFAPQKNPEPVQVKDGFQVPYWESLNYLEKLAAEIREGKELEHIDDILSIIKDVSENPRDNYRTWYVFIKLLGSFPNDRIPKEILKYIPTWLGGRFDTMLQSSQIIEHLLPKFLSEDPTEDDIEKAELILTFLFTINKKRLSSEEMWKGETNRYTSRVYLHYLSDRFIEKDIISKIAKFCSTKFLLDLGITLKELLLDFPYGINTRIISGEKEYNIRVWLEEKDLILSSKAKSDDTVITTSILHNYEEYSAENLKKELINEIKGQGIEYIESLENSRDFTDEIIFNLNNDMASALNITSIGQLGDMYYHDDRLLEVFSLIFRDLLNEIVKEDSIEGRGILEKIIFDKHYKIPYFIRMALYVIGQNWNITKQVFWELVNNEDSNLIFSKHKYQNELFELLSKNQHSLTKEEKSSIENIITGGPKDVEIPDENYTDYWQLRWYSALKETEPFKEKYTNLSYKLNISNEHFENSGRVTVRSGSISPLKEEELFEKSNAQIADYIMKFRPKDRWEEPNISGLSNTFGEAVKSNPDFFANDLKPYLEIPYIYMHYMLYGFREAWQNNKQFNWKNILDFCLSYISNEKFYQDKLYIEGDSWNAKSDWVVGAIANLIDAGTQKDNNAFDSDLLPIAKKILTVLAKNLVPGEKPKDLNSDYVTYSLNSTGGKVLRSLLDYSLRKARTSQENKNEVKWESEIKQLFEEASTKEIIDIFILEGMYYEQFYYLDKDWMIARIEANQKLSEDNWLAFMGGFAFSNPPFNKTLYELFIPHYKKAIDGKVNFKSLYGPGIIRHLVAFYFWGYERLDKGSLISKFLNEAPLSSISELVSFIWQQENYMNGLNSLEKKQLQDSIIELWSFLANKFKDAKNEEEQGLLANLSHLIEFAPELDERITKLILISSPHTTKRFYTHELLENLKVMRERGIPAIAADGIGKILESISFTDYFPDFDAQVVVELMEFLYENNQKTIANSIANKLSSKGHTFLKSVYNKYNP